MKRKKSPWIIGIAFALVVWVLMLVFEHDMLFRSQELNLWLPTQMWFERRMTYPAGMLTVFSTFLTQFMYYPWLGALLLVGLWLLVYWQTLKVFHIPARRAALALIPVALLIGCALEFGYWIYITKTQGYLFTAAVGYTLTMAAVYVWQKIRRPLWQVVWIVVLVGGGFPLFGFYALLAALVIALLAVIDKPTVAETAEAPRSKWPQAAVAAVCIAITPYLYYYAYTMIRQGWIYLAGYPDFDIHIKLLKDWMPYILLAICPVVMACFARKFASMTNADAVPVAADPEMNAGKHVGKKAAKKAPKRGLSKTQVAALCWNGSAIIVAAAIVVFFWYKDPNYHAELKMEAAMEKMDYKGVLDVAKMQKKEPTRLIVMAKNLALLKLGRGGYEMFTYLDGGAKPNTPLDIRMMQAGGKMLYYNYGRFNFCYRWCLEDGVEYGWKVEYLKYMTKTSILSGDYEIARKYINTLSKTIFHHKWAEKYRQFVDDPKLIAQDKEFATILPMYCYDDQLDGDNSLVEIYLLNYFSHAFGGTTPMFDEQGLMCALILKDIPTFWTNFFRYANSHLKDKMPTHYQEAALLFGNLEPGKVDISSMPFDKSVKMKFKAFMEYARANAIADNAERDPVIKQKFFERFGDTYYYFYFFIRDVKSY